MLPSELPPVIQRRLLAYVASYYSQQYARMPNLARPVDMQPAVTMVKAYGRFWEVQVQYSKSGACALYGIDWLGNSELYAD